MTASTSPSVIQALAELENGDQPGALCTIIRSLGSTPRRAGSKMLVYPDGSFIGTVGGGELESRVLAEAMSAISDGKTRLIEYHMSDPERGDPGVCGGTVNVFIEPFLPKATVAVIGGGHVGKAVAFLAKWLGFRVVICDDRPDFCTPESVPGADAYYPAPMSDLPSLMDITPWTYLVLTTRNAQIDADGLPALLDTPAGYIGVIGSRKRWETTRKLLQEKGISAESILRVRSPVGLELNAETPEEIAVSILAEIIILRRGGNGKSMSER